MEYFSQVKQDKFINEKIFKNYKNGFFIDIGAFDGITFSNSLFFEKYLNWNGICFEPNPNEFKKLKKNRRCECLKLGIGTKNEVVKFINVKNAPMLSGIKDNINKKEISKYKEKEIIEIKIIKLNEYLEKKKINKINYLSLDIEGKEEEILKEFDFKNVFIDVISVEDNQNIKKVDKILNDNNFILVEHKLFDKIFINKNSKFYSKKLIPNIMKAKIYNSIIGSKIEKKSRNILKKNSKLYKKIINFLT